MRRTKIIATLGPASSDPVMLARMIRGGMDVARLNFSHGTNADHTRAIRRVRHASQRVGRTVGLLLDLQGPRLRVGEFEGGSVRVVSGATVLVTNTRGKGTAGRIPVLYSGLMKDVAPGDRVLIDDGKVILRVTGKSKGGLRCRVLAGGQVSDHKGVNFPGVRLSAPSMTPKDRRDLAFGLEMGVDFVALSFVRRAEDITGLRRLLRRAQHPPMLIAKIERREAIENLESILDVADGVMVARGDLGVEYPAERVPILQKRIIERANAREVLVITATQMLETMVASATPTRAEASDVATAIYDGADAVMLSAETAVGQYPIEAAAMMDRIAKRVQADPLYFANLDAGRMAPEHTDRDAISAAACQVAETIGAAAIVSFTSSGATALRAARERPAAPILVLTPHVGTARRLALLWGAHCVHLADITSFADMVQKAVRTAHREEIAGPGQRVVITAGVPFGTPGSTNVLRIAWVDR